MVAIQQLTKRVERLEAKVEFLGRTMREHKQQARQNAGSDIAFANKAALSELLEEFSVNPESKLAARLRQLLNNAQPQKEEGA